MDRVGPFNTTTLTVPYGSLAAWQNANPPGGIEGSVPSIEAWTHLIEEVVYAVEQSGQTPDHTNLHQLWPAIVAASGIITTAVTKTVYGGGADFATLLDAYAWLSTKRIASTGSVTFQLAAGTFTITGPTNSPIFRHPDGQRVTIQGATMIGAVPVYASFTVTGPSSGQRTADKATNLANLTAAYGTKLSFTGGARMELASDVGLLKNILLIGDGSAVDGLTYRQGLIISQGISVANFGGRNILIASGANVVSTGMASSGGTTGISVEDGGTVDELGNMVAVSAVANGVQALSMGNIRTVTSGTLSGAGNGNNGIVSQDNATVACAGTNSRANLNGASGFVALNAGRMDASSTAANSNVNAAYSADHGGIVSATNTSGTGNGSGMFANIGSFIRATGSALTGFSPTLNTVGNSGSWIVA